MLIESVRGSDQSIQSTISGSIGSVHGPVRGLDRSIRSADPRISGSIDRRGFVLIRSVCGSIDLVRGSADQSDQYKQSADWRSMDQAHKIQPWSVKYKTSSLLVLLLLGMLIHLPTHPRLLPPPFHLQTQIEYFLKNKHALINIC